VNAKDEDNDEVEMKIVFPLLAPNTNSSIKKTCGRGKKNNKLLTILQQQFANHWHKRPEEGARRELKKEEKIWKIVISYHRLFCKLNLN
jgi:hypothetical protein